MTETERLENKASLSEWKEIVESIAAFASVAGGVVRVGIDPDGSRVGVSIGKGTLENLANQIKVNTDPPQYPSVVIESLGERHIIEIRVTESPIKPVWAFHRPVKRVGRTNQHLTREEAHRLMDISDGRFWDALPCREFQRDDVEMKAVSHFAARSGVSEVPSWETLLTNLGLSNSGAATNAAVLLFASNPQRFFPQAVVKCARFYGTSSSRFLDEQTFAGDALSQLDGAVAFVRRNTQQRIVISGKIQHDVIPEYPEAAVREAITNAICHREYSWPGTVQVRVYDDRMEVWNPGSMAPGMSVEALYTEHPSRPRNPVFASALHRAGIIEQWGSGTVRIIEAMKQSKLPMPEFAVEMDTFRVRLWNGRTSAYGESRVPLERQLRALEYAREHGSISTREYQALFDLGRKQAQKDLSALCGQGFLTREGRGAGTVYRVAEAS